MFNEDSLYIDEKSKEALEHKFGFTEEALNQYNNQEQDKFISK
jgi:hypothetical protein